MQNEDKQPKTENVSTKPNVPVAEPVVDEALEASDAPRVEEETPAENTEADEVVDDIVANEGDELLAVQDKEIAEAFEPKKPLTLKAKIKALFWRWWNNKKVRYLSLAGLGLLVVLLFSIPPSRYFILNNVGVRASTSLAVYDDSTHQPLKNVQVSAGGQKGISDDEGKVTLRHVRLGSTTLLVQKRAFADSKKPITLGWGSNPLANVDIKPVGTQFRFEVNDWLSDKPVAKARATSGEFEAISDEKGVLVLTVDAAQDDALQTTITADGYRDEKVTLDFGNKATQKVALVAGRKQAFISKRSGKYDLYKIDVDGKNESLALAGTGLERDDMALIPHPTSELVALVSSRENTRNKDGYLLSTLTLVDLTDNSTTRVAQSEQIQVMGWAGDRLVYAQVAAGASAANIKRQRLMTYDQKSGESKELASSNSFNDIMLVGNTVYYAPSNVYLPSAATGLYRQNVDGNSKVTLLDKETWNMFRTSYSGVDVSVGQDWYKFNMGDAKAVKQAGAPANTKSRLYIDSPDGTKSLWVDERDGKGTLVLYDVGDKTEKVLKQQGGLNNPVRWLNDSTVVYRIQTPQETAEYVLNINAGDAKKIRDVTNTSGTERWYYY